MERYLKALNRRIVIVETLIKRLKANKSNLKAAIKSSTNTLQINSREANPTIGTLDGTVLNKGQVDSKTDEVDEISILPSRLDTILNMARNSRVSQAASKATSSSGSARTHGSARSKKDKATTKAPVTSHQSAPRPPDTINKETINKVQPPQIEKTPPVPLSDMIVRQLLYISRCKLVNSLKPHFRKELQMMKIKFLQHRNIELSNPIFELIVKNYESYYSNRMRRIAESFNHSISSNTNFKILHERKDKFGLIEVSQWTYDNCCEYYIMWLKYRLHLWFKKQRTLLQDGGHRRALKMNRTIDDLFPRFSSAVYAVLHMPIPRMKMKVWYPSHLRVADEKLRVAQYLLETNLEFVLASRYIPTIVQLLKECCSSARGNEEWKSSLTLYRMVYCLLVGESCMFLQRSTS